MTNLFTRALLSLSLPQRLRTAPLLLAAMWLASGCATNPDREAPEPARFLHDAAFPGSVEYRVESREDVFHLDAQAREYLEEKIGIIRASHYRSQALVEEIFSRSALSLSYDEGANTTASETFGNQAANCLSMSILAYSMAQYVGYDAQFQEVDIPEYWERRSGHNVVARHVNLVLKPEKSPGSFGTSHFIQVDFLTLGDTRQYKTRPIPQSRVLAMFYNNKGTDALFAGNDDMAYAYLRAALLQDPSLDMAISNLGLLYWRNGHRQWAEENYREAARMNPGNTVSAEGLAMVFSMTGREDEAAAIMARLERQRQDNPYYHYVQGEAAYDTGDWRRAIHAFRRAIELKPNADRPYFGLARTWLRMGDDTRAAAYLRRAEHYANRDDLKQKYRNKITALSNL